MESDVKINRQAAKKHHSRVKRKTKEAGNGDGGARQGSIDQK